MTDQTQETKSVQVEPVRLSEKVTPVLLDRIYNNFVKITDWVVKGKESKYPLPKALAWLFDTAERNANEVAELKQLVTTLQSSLIDKEQRITALDSTLQNVNSALKQLVDLVNIQQPSTTFTPPAQLDVSEPVVSTSTPTVDELVDLDTVTGDTSSEQVSPNEQAIQVSAAAVGAGNIDPASYQALDAEINALLSK